jgi:hypothetical protein
MRVRFHLSFDVVSKSWHLEAHDVQERRWFLVPEASWHVQLKTLCSIGVGEEEQSRLVALEATGKLSAWLDAREVDPARLFESGFILQTTRVALPRQ